MSTPYRMLSIAEMADRYGVTLRTLRFYEQSGLLEPLRRGTNRFYRPKDQVRLELILKGRHFGFTLHEIQKLIRQGARPVENDTPNLIALLDKETLAHQTRHLERRKAEIEKAIEELQAALSRRLVVA